MTDRLVAPDQVPASTTAVAQKSANATKEASQTKAAETQKEESKDKSAQIDKAKLEKEVVQNQKAKESTLDGGIEIETSSLDFDNTPTAGPVKVGLAQYANVDEWGLVQLNH